MVDSDVHQLLLSVHFVLNFKIRKPTTTKEKLRQIFTKYVTTFLQNDSAREQTRYFNDKSLVTQINSKCINRPVAAAEIRHLVQ